MYTITCSVIKLLSSNYCAGGDLRKEGCWVGGDTWRTQTKSCSDTVKLTRWRKFTCSIRIHNKQEGCLKKINLPLSFRSTKTKSRALEKLHYRHWWDKRRKPITSNLHLVLLLLAALDLLVYFSNLREKCILE